MEDTSYLPVKENSEILLGFIGENFTVGPHEIVVAENKMPIVLAREVLRKSSKESIRRDIVAFAGVVIEKVIIIENQTHLELTLVRATSEIIGRNIMAMVDGGIVSKIHLAPRIFQRKLMNLVNIVVTEGITYGHIATGKIENLPGFSGYTEAEPDEELHLIKHLNHCLVEAMKASGIKGYKEMPSERILSKVEN